MTFFDSIIPYISKHWIFGFLILAGFLLLIASRVKANTFFGYRTPRSLKNKANWVFAQKRSSIHLIVSSIIGLAFNVFASDYFESGPYIFVRLLSLVLIAAYTIFRTEKELKSFEAKS